MIQENYKAIAEIIKVFFYGWKYNKEVCKVLKLVTKDLADYFDKENETNILADRFNHKQFLKDSGVEQ